MKSAFKNCLLTVLCITGLSCLDVYAQTTKPSPSIVPVRVALYSDVGSKTAYQAFEKCLDEEPARFKTKVVTAEDIRSGILKDFDVLVQGGGSGSKCAQTLGEEGRTEIKSFVQRGGGYLGVCAGAYLASSEYPWSLGIINTKVVDRQHWARGKGMVKIQVDQTGKDMLGIKPVLMNVRYAQGPLMAPADRTDLPAYTELAKFETEIAENGAPKGVMIGKTALAAAPFGEGRVVCSSPHPESHKAYYGLIQNIVLWLAKHPTTETITASKPD